MKIVGIGGSLRKESRAYMALDLALKSLHSEGCETCKIDLRELDLPFCNGGTEYPDYPDVAMLRSEMKSARGLVLATPEYHGSISGVLKNALDLLSEEHIRGKVCGIIVVLGGPFSIGASDVIRQICHQLHAWTLPKELYIPYADQAFDSEGKLADPVLRQRMKELTTVLVDSCRKLT